MPNPNIAKPLKSGKERDRQTYPVIVDLGLFTVLFITRNMQPLCQRTGLIAGPGKVQAPNWPEKLLAASHSCQGLD